MPQLEIEYKTLLTASEYQRLSALFSVEPITQTNYYLDTADFDLKKNRLSLRIRRFNDKAELTLKIPQDVGNLEHNLAISLNQADAIISGNQLPDNVITSLIQSYDIPVADIKVWGDLTTKRLEEKTPIGLMALDLNHYDNQTDYELELEVTDAEKGKREFERFLKEQKITFKYAKSKVARLAHHLF